MRPTNVIPTCRPVPNKTAFNSFRSALHIESLNCSPPPRPLPAATSIFKITSSRFAEVNPSNKGSHNVVHPLLHSLSNARKKTFNQHEHALVKKTTHTAHTIRPVPDHNLPHAPGHAPCLAPVQCPKVQNYSKLTFMSNRSAKRKHNVKLTVDVIVNTERFALCTPRVHRDAKRRNQKFPNATVPVSPAFPLNGKHVNVVLALRF